MKARGIVGKKIGMTQIFDSNGLLIPVTVVKAGPCVVLAKKSADGKDGYSAVKLGFDEKKESRVAKPQLGEYKKLGVTPVRFVRELRVNQEDLAEYELGQEIKADVFEAGDIVNVTGKSKGKGFAGVMKTYGFGGGKDGHGVHEYFRHGGSVGCASYPAKVFKGKKMPGQHTNRTETVENLTVVKVDVENSFIFIRGAVPGSRNSLVVIRNSKKKWKRQG